MRGNSQLLRSTNARVLETGSMKTPVMLLLTNDNGLEDLVADTLSEIGGISHLTRDAGDATREHGSRIEQTNAGTGACLIGGHNNANNESQRI
jgi:hypothetical protein